MKKRLFAVLLLAVMAITMLASCTQTYPENVARAVVKGLSDKDAAKIALYFHEGDEDAAQLVINIFYGILRLTGSEVKKIEFVSFEQTSVTAEGADRYGGTEICRADVEVFITLKRGDTTVTDKSTYNWSFVKIEGKWYVLSLV